jgi:Spy/CpxP family protein refolding chaperone
MKAFFSIVALAGGLVSFSASAQMADRELPVPAIHQTPTSAAALTRDMTNKLQLNEGQYLKLLPVNRTRLARLNAINRQYKNDEATRAAKIAELDAYYEQECSRILTPSQLSQLQDNRQSQPAQAGNGVG